MVINVVDKQEEFINKLTERILSVYEIYEIVEKRYIDKLENNCKTVALRSFEIGKELQELIDRVKKDTNYPDINTSPVNDIEELEYILHEAMQIPLYQIGLIENLGKGIDFIIDEIIRTIENLYETRTQVAIFAKKLFPNEKEMKYYSKIEFVPPSEVAKLFIDYVECQTEKYKKFVIELLKIICGED